jgi:Ohr subfamily peroxiredoxin
MTVKPEKILYTAHATSTGGREGTSKSDDGVLDLKLTTPKGLGGNGAVGTNPEQLFAAGYSACFIGAMKHVAMLQKIALPADTSINADVGIGQIPQGFGIQVWLKVHIPDMDKAQAEKIVEAAHVVCPYSNATRGNVEVTLDVV